MAVERGRGVYIPTEPGKRHEPMVGPGVSVWAVISYLRAHDWNDRGVLQEFDGILTEDDIAAARKYYEENAEEIDAVLAASR